MIGGFNHLSHRRIHWAHPLVHTYAGAISACMHIPHFLGPFHVNSGYEYERSRIALAISACLPPSASPSAPALRIRVVLLPTPPYCSLFAINAPSISALDILLMSVPTYPVFAIYFCLYSLFSFLSFLFSPFFSLLSLFSLFFFLFSLFYLFFSH